VLTDLGSIDGFNGTEVSITGGFENMNGFTGSGAMGDSLTGRNVPTTWAVDGSKVYINGTTTFTMTGPKFDRGSDADTFNISGIGHLRCGVEKAPMSSTLRIPRFLRNSAW
jgi:hypothetical protein